MSATKWFQSKRQHFSLESGTLTKFWNRFNAQFSIIFPTKHSMIDGIEVMCFINLCLQVSPVVISLRLSIFSSSHPLESGEVKWLRPVLVPSSRVTEWSSLVNPLVGSFFSTMSSLVNEDTSSDACIWSGHSTALFILHWLSVVDGFLCGFDRIFSMEKLFRIVIVFSEFMTIFFGTNKSQYLVIDGSLVPKKKPKTHYDQLE